MKLIVGLGNPGKEYDHTRHNTGFMFVDFVLGALADRSPIEKRVKDSITYHCGTDLILAKPQTFMNLSGIAVKQLISWYDIVVEQDLILVHDDLDIKLGKFKHQFAKAPKDHKGVISVENHVGTTKFHRLRIGVDNRQHSSIDGDKYVLDKFTSDELVTLQQVFDAIHISDLLRSQ